MMRRMATRRILVSMELISPEGYRMQFDEKGWHLLNRRQLGEAEREKALALCDTAEDCLPPVDEVTLAPPTLHEIGEFAAKTLGLRITHHHFKQK